MNRKEPVEAVARQAGLTGAQADAAVGAVVECAVRRAPRMGRNPQTGEVIDIEASDAPAFKPAPAYKQAVSGS